MTVDIQGLGEIINLASQAVQTTKNGASLVDTLKGVFKRSEAAGDADLKMAISELALQVGEASLANADLQVKLADFQREALKTNKFEAEVKRYTLWETPRGDFIYRLDAAKDQGQPLHHICPNCVEKEQKSILQGGNYVNTCPNCKAKYKIGQPPTRKPRGMSRTNV